MISISHYFEKLEIKLSFPGDNYPDNSKINFKNSKNQEFNIDKTKNGKIILETISRGKKNKLNCDIQLDFNTLSLIKIKFNFNIPEHYGLILFDENEIEIQSIKTLKNMPKDIFLFNMANNEINLKYNYNKNYINLDNEEKIIYPGKNVKLQIKKNRREKKVYSYSK